MTAGKSDAKAIAVLYCSAQTAFKKDRIKVSFLFGLFDAGILLRSCLKIMAESGATPVFADYAETFYAMSRIFLVFTAFAVTLLSLCFLRECITLGRALLLYGADRVFLWKFCVWVVSFFYFSSAKVTWITVVISCTLPFLREAVLFYTVLHLLISLLVAWLADQLFLYVLIGISLSRSCPTWSGAGRQAGILR